VELIPPLRSSYRCMSRNTLIEGAQSTAKHNTTAATIGLEDQLWRAADALCSNVDAVEHKHVALSLICLKLSTSLSGHSTITWLRQASPGSNGIHR
jgi:hypothetical protein